MRPRSGWGRQGFLGKSGSQGRPLCKVISEPRPEGSNPRISQGRSRAKALGQEHMQPGPGQCCWGAVEVVRREQTLLGLVGGIGLVFISLVVIQLTTSWWIKTMECILSQFGKLKV